jgi:hypothetical protein
MRSAGDPVLPNTRSNAARRSTERSIAEVGLAVAQDVEHDERDAARGAGGAGRARRAGPAARA